MAGNFSAISNPKRRAFLQAYSRVGMLTKAAEMAGCDIHSHYYWMRDQQYQQAFAEARQMVADLHEDEATRRAMGWDEEYFLADGTSKTIKKYSDTLLIVRLKALKPQDYRENIRLDADITVTLEASLQQGMKRLEVLRVSDASAA